MITHEEAKHVVQVATSGLDMRDKLFDYISQQEKLQAELEALKRDVARYFELQTLDRVATHEETKEVCLLYGKFIKAGKEE